MARNKPNFTKENIVTRHLPSPGTRQTCYATRIHGIGATLFEMAAKAPASRSWTARCG